MPLNVGVSVHGDHGVNVRKATTEDLSTLVRFTAQEAEEAEGSRKNIKRLELGIRTALEDHSIAIYWILADETDKPIGSISTLKEWSDWNAGYYWWIQSMYIVPEQRGKGYVSILLDAVVKEMECQQGLELRLYVHESNTKAIRAYKKAGFEKSPYELMVRQNEH
jgi:ribosomal protein S18 acetylase RimI-like enzyme